MLQSEEGKKKSRTVCLAPGSLLSLFKSQHNQIPPTVLVCVGQVYRGSVEHKRYKQEEVERRARLSADCFCGLFSSHAAFFISNSSLFYTTVALCHCVVSVLVRTVVCFFFFSLYMWDYESCIQCGFWL